MRSCASWSRGSGPRRRWRRPGSWSLAGSTGTCATRCTWPCWPRSSGRPCSWAGWCCWPMPWWSPPPSWPSSTGTRSRPWPSRSGTATRSTGGPGRAGGPAAIPGDRPGTGSGSTSGGRGQRHPGRRRAGDVDQPVRRLLPDHPGHRRQGVPAAGRRAGPLQEARHRHVRHPDRPRRPAGAAPGAVLLRRRRSDGGRGQGRRHPHRRGHGPDRAAGREGRPMTLDIEVAGLQLRYGAVTALVDLSFTLPGGRIYGLLGRNGSGKTSLLSVLAGFRKASEGTVLVGGQPVFENPAVTRRVCLIRETGDTGDRDDRITDALSTASHLRPGWDGDYADSLVDRFQVPRRKKLGELSLGQRSALGMTFGLASRAPVTLFDESHLGMDAPSRAAFHDEVLSDFMAHPRTIVVSTHLIDELSPLFEEVVIIDNGRLVLQDETEVLRARGADVTGPAEAGHPVLGGPTRLRERQLGRTKSAMVYGGARRAHPPQGRGAGAAHGPSPPRAC